MMLGEGNRRHPTVHIPPWPVWDEPTIGIGYHLTRRGCAIVSGREAAMLAAMQRFLHSAESPHSPHDPEEVDPAGVTVDGYSCDRFRMYEFKIRRCRRGRSHDWTECPFAHPGEKARRRDPLRFRYSSAPCPDFRKGSCKKGEACELAHGVFECWLHPERYRTQPCKDGTACRRLVCFFAHTPEQLRVLSPRAPETLISSPTSTLISPPLSPPYDSPPLSPCGVDVRRGSTAIASSLKKLQISSAKHSAAAWGVQMVGREGGFVGGFSNMPPSTEVVGGDDGLPEEEQTGSDGPDVGWVAELLK